MSSFPRPPIFPSDDEIKAKYNLSELHRLHFNESPLGPSPQVVEAVQKAATNLGQYPDLSDIRLREALAETWGHTLSPDHFYVGASGFESLEMLFRAYVQAGDEVIFCPPTFDVYRRLALQCEAEQVRIPLLRPDFQVDVDSVLAAITAKTRLIVLCNPNNPTGSVLTAAEMTHLVDHLPEHVLLASDEVYFHFVNDPDFPHSLDYVLAEKNVILIHSFSKAYGLPGLRLGYGIAKPDIANHIGGLTRAFHHNHLALVAGLVALQDQAHLQANVQVVLDGKAWLYTQLDALDVDYWPSQTNFILMEMHRPAEEAAEHLRRFGVLVRPQNHELETCLRVTVGLPAANAKFIEGLRDYLESKS